MENDIAIVKKLSEIPVFFTIHLMNNIHNFV